MSEQVDAQFSVKLIHNIWGDHRRNDLMNRNIRDMRLEPLDVAIQLCCRLGGGGPWLELNEMDKGVDGKQWDTIQNIMNNAGYKW